MAIAGSDAPERLRGKLSSTSEHGTPPGTGREIGRCRSTCADQLIFGKSRVLRPPTINGHTHTQGGRPCPHAPMR